MSKKTKYTIQKKYIKYGIDGLKESRTCEKYSNKLKELALKKLNQL